MRFQPIRGREKSWPKHKRERIRRWVRFLKNVHDIPEPMKWLRRNYHKLPTTLINKILRLEGSKGKWKKRPHTSASTLMRRVKHGRWEFSHSWNPRTGLRIRRLGKGVGRGFLSHAVYKAFKRHGRGRHAAMW